MASPSPPRPNPLAPTSDTHVEAQDYEGASPPSNRGTYHGPPVEKTSLFCVNPLQSVLAHYSAGYIADPDSRAALADLWRRKNEVYFRNNRATRSHLGPRDLTSLSAEVSDQADTLLSRLKQYPPFETCNVQYYNVALAKLITPQLTVTDTRVDAQAARIDPRMSDEAKLEFTSGRGARDAGIRHQVLFYKPDSGAHLFTTVHEDVRLLLPPQIVQIPLNESDSEAGFVSALAFPVAEGLPFVHAYKVRIAPTIERVILANGVHRVTAALRRGLTSLPIAVCDMTPGEIPNPFVELSHAFVFNPGADPPLVSDFLDSAVAAKIKFHPGHRGIRLDWKFEQSHILSGL